MVQCLERIENGTELFAYKSNEKSHLNHGHKLNIYFYSPCVEW